MNNRVLEQIDKVLALTESNHDGEALEALRTARRMLEREGLSFTDLVQAARRARLADHRALFSGTQGQLEAQMDLLHDEINAHIEQNQSLSGQIEFWKRRAFELEQMLSLNQAEAARWKEMARETAERLWDLGQMARADAFLSPDPAPEDLMSNEELPPLKAAG